MEEENKFIAFLVKNWSKLLLGVLMAACAAVWTERFFRTEDKQNKQDFLIANQIFEQFNKGKFLPVESIEAAENILLRHPELHPKYDSMMALIFFSQAKQSQGLKYAKSMLKKIDTELPPFYQRYARCTLLISEENYTQAFKDSWELHGELHGQRDYQTLDAMNILRLLFLADRMGDTQQKNLFWKELEHHPGFAVIKPLFHEGNLSLENYIFRKTYPDHPQGLSG